MVSDWENPSFFNNFLSFDRRIVNITVPYESGTEGTKLAYQLRDGDYIAVELDLPEKDIYGWCTCQIIDAKPTSESWIVDLKIRIFGFGPNRILAKQEGNPITTEDGKLIEIEGIDWIKDII